ncbi:MAG: EAL domain-containing protein [Spirochaetales bacterium]|nr:EAL domain-containing protein [Spirochaetales bacterium]
MYIFLELGLILAYTINGLIMGNSSTNKPDNLKTKKELLEEIAALRQKLSENSESYKLKLSTEKLLKEQDSLYRLAIENANLIPYRLNFDDDTYVFMGHKIQDVLGLSPSELTRTKLTSLIEEIIIPRNSGFEDGQECDDAFKRGEMSFFRADLKMKTATGTIKWINDSSVPVWDESGKKVIGSLGMFQDITDRKLVEDALFREKQRAVTILESISDGVIVTDANGTITYLNRAACSITGIKLFDACGMKLGEICRIEGHSGNASAETLVEKVMNEKRPVRFPQLVNIRSRTGEEYENEISAVPLIGTNKEITGVIVTCHDVSEMQKMSRKIDYQSTRDIATGLINRISFEELLADQINAAKNELKTHALCVVQVDQYKIVNDSHGQPGSDDLLRHVTNIIGEAIRASDVLSRVGTNQFGLLLLSCPIDTACTIIETVRSHLKELPFVFDKNTYKIDISVGIVPIDQNSEDEAQAMSNAEIASAFSTQSGGYKIKVYNPKDEDVTKLQSEILFLPSITKALEEDRFCLYMQKIQPVSGDEDGSEHIEVLVRMIGEDGGLIAPGRFIPLAERYNIMPDIDKWVINRVFDIVHKKMEDNKRRYSINLSGRSLSNEEFLSFVIEKCRDMPVPANSICFEITETQAIINISRVSRLIHELKKFGFQFSLDDFGSGWSSFNYLKLLSVDYLKIDGSFVKGMIDNPVDLLLVETINHIGHKLGLQTIAEFVENENILKKISSLGVDHVQGFAVARPVPLI